MKKALGFLALVFAGFLAAVPTVPVQDLTFQHFGGYDVPFVPTPPEVVDEMLRLAEVKAGDILYDLGCGDGRIVIAAAKKFGVKATGIDIDPVRIKESNENADKAGLTGKVRFLQENLFDADFKDATVITMYLLTSVNLRLRPKLLTDLKPGTRLVSHSFEMGDWRPDKTSVVTTTFGDERDVHFWVVPANVTGVWMWNVPGAEPGTRDVLEASQQFQVVTASGREGDWPLSIGEVKLRGDAISFRIDSESEGKMVSRLYDGKVSGNSIVGTVRKADDPKSPALAWKAFRDPKTVVSIIQ